MRTTVATDTRLLGIGGVDWWRRRGSGGRRTGSLNSRERNAALGSLTTHWTVAGRYANLISRKWTSCPLESSMRACAATLMRECSWRRGDGVAGGGTAGKRKANSTSFAWPACSKWACNLRIATATLFDDICENQRWLGIYVDSCAKVAREIEIRRDTENLDAIKCTSDLWSSSRSSSSCGLKAWA